MKKAIAVGVVMAVVMALALPGLARTVAPRGAGPTADVMIVDTARASVEVVNIDTDRRIVSLKMPNGKVRTFKVSKEHDLSKLKSGDVLTASVTEAMAVYIEKSRARPRADEMTTVRLSPRGDERRVLMVDTVRLVGKTQAIDTAKRTVTILGPAGRTRVLKVGENVRNLHLLKAGDDVIVRHTEALAIDLRKPARAN